MDTKAFSFILGITRSQLTKHVAPRVVDENILRWLKTATKKISERTKDLLLKDLNTAQNILEPCIIRLKNRFVEEPSDKNKSGKNLKEEIDKDLKNAQTFATSGRSSALGAVEEVACLKISLMVECLLLLNTCSSLEKIKKKEEKEFENKLRNAKEICYLKLQDLNSIKEVSEYVSNKLKPTSIRTRLSTPSASSIDKDTGISKADLVRDVLAINFYVRLFLHQWDAKLYSVKPDKKKGFQKPGKTSGVMQELSIMRDDGVKGTPTEKKAQMLAVYDFLFVGAAFSVIKQDGDLAEIILEYTLTLGKVEQQICMNLLKRDLPTNKGVQKAIDKRKSGSDTITKRLAKKLGSFDEDTGGVPDMAPKVKTIRYLDVLNRLSTPAVRYSSLQTTCGADGSTSVVSESGIDIVPSPIVEVPLLSC